MTRRPVFWVVFSLLAVAGLVAAIRLFPLAFPLVTLDIRMDREAALAGADSLADRYGWEPRGGRSAATFGQTDPEVQSYVEFEGGGRDAFVSLADRGVYQPYVWSVRRFAEGEVEESWVRFTPRGRPYGFRLELPEDDPGGGNLDPGEARELALDAAADWGVDLEAFEVLESSEEALPGGRVDYTIVLERTDETVADARFRLRLRVTGDRLAELTHFVHVPEAFTRRFQEMRSTNASISLVAEAVLIVVFVLLGAGVGTAILLRRGWVVWRKPLVWGGVVAVLMGLNVLNGLPLSWLGYDTAVPVGTFLLGQALMAGGIVVLGAPMLAFFFLAAESLGRRAFPDHLQQWRFWSRDVASSTPALGRTVGAYLLVGVELGYVVLFYLGTSRLEGWWSPAEALVQPDLLATIQPWLQAVSVSLFAAFWEESVFRAVPIACAALLGARYGRRAWWIWGAVVLQSLVFAAAHAGYPQQPAYARVVELTLPALGWGVIYVWFGLVPTIVTHFLYDLSLLSLPLFAADAPGVWLDRSVVALAALAPVGVVLVARLGGRARARAPEEAYNRAWAPREHEEEERSPSSPETEQAVEQPPDRGPALDEARDAVSRRAPAAARDEAPEAVREGGRDSGGARWGVGLAWGLGVVGAVVWIVTVTGAPDAPGLTVTRTEALSAARAELRSRGHGVEGWTGLTSVAAGRGIEHRYVAEEAGEERYHELVGRYLQAPRWVVRFIDFEAEPEERVEEFRVHVGGGARVLNVEHVLPEARQGAGLDEEAARGLALRALGERLGMAPGDLEEVAAEETSRPARVDWTFTFADPSVLPGVEGEGRIEVEISGEEVTWLGRFTHVPQEWERERRATRSRGLLVVGTLVAALFLAFGAACVVGVVAWARSRFAVGIFFKVSAVALAALVLTEGNGWPSVTGGFTSDQPWGLQIGVALLGLSLALVVAAGAVGLVAGLAHTWLRETGTRGGRPTVGVALGLALAGAVAAGRSAFATLPPWPGMSEANAYAPSVAGAMGPVMDLLFLGAGLLALAAFLERARARAWWHSGLAYLLILAVGFLGVPESLQESPLAWVGAGLLAAGAVLLLTRTMARAPALAPGLVATFLALDLLADAAEGPYPGAGVGAVLGVALLVVLAVAWTRVLSAHVTPSGAPAPWTADGPGGSARNA